MIPGLNIILSSFLFFDLKNTTLKTMSVGPCYCKRVWHFLHGGNKESPYVLWADQKKNNVAFEGLHGCIFLKPYLNWNVVRMAGGMVLLETEVCLRILNAELGFMVYGFKSHFVSLYFKNIYLAICSPNPISLSLLLV